MYRLHNVTSQKIIILIVPAAITSNFTQTEWWLEQSAKEDIGA